MADVIDFPSNDIELDRYVLLGKTPEGRFVWSFPEDYKEASELMAMGQTQLGRELLPE